MNKHQIKAFVEANPKLVQRKPTSNPELFVLKYTRKVFYDNLWTPELLVCRGTVVDRDYNTVSRPFTKVFNYLENDTKIDMDEMCTYVRKVNGFMAAVTLYNDEILISTTGSIDSAFVTLARGHLASYLDAIKAHLQGREFEGYDYQTFIFEIVDKSDPHIVQEEDGAYLIGVNYNRWDSYLPSEALLDAYAYELGCKRPDHDYARFSDILEEVKTVKHEGFMVYGDSGTTLKLKSPHYLSKKALIRMGVNQVDKVFDKPEGFKRRLDEEFYAVYEHILENETKESWFALEESGRKAWIEEYFNAR